MSKDYIELEYIESTGTQYIDLNYIPTSNVNFEIKTRLTKTLDTRDGCLFGTRSDIDTGFVLWFNNYSSSSLIDIQLAIDSVKPTEMQYSDFDTNYTIKYKNHILYVNNESVYSYSSNPTIAHSLYLFALNHGGSVDSRIFLGRVYFFKLYDDDTLVRDFIPVKRKSDNEICLYDKVTKQYFLNQGTGEFIAGPEIPEPTLHENVSLINTQISNLKSLTDEILGITPGPEIVPFATATDEQISALLDAHYRGDIDLSEIWNVGDTRVIHIDALTAPVAGSNKAHAAQDMTFRIIGFNHDNLTTSIGNVTKAAVTIECKEVLGDYGTSEYDYLSVSFDGSTYENPKFFNNAYRRTWLNNNFVDALPATFKTLVKEVVKRNLQGHNNTTNYVETNDKVFLLSYPEIFSSTYNYYRSGAALNDIEGTQYSYYNQNNTNTGRVKYLNSNGTASSKAYSYWLRSPSSNFGSTWCRVYSDGSANDNFCNSTSGLAPALAI